MIACTIIFMFFRVRKHMLNFQTISAILITITTLEIHTGEGFFVSTPHDIYNTANSKIVKLGLELIKKRKKKKPQHSMLSVNFVTLKSMKHHYFSPTPRLTNIQGITFSDLTSIILMACIRKHRFKNKFLMRGDFHFTVDSLHSFKTCLILHISRQIIVSTTLRRRPKPFPPHSIAEGCLSQCLSAGVLGNN